MSIKQKQEKISDTLIPMYFLLISKQFGQFIKIKKTKKNSK